MKIGILTHNYPRNKKERKDAGVFLMDFANELSKKFDVSVFSPDFGGVKESYVKIPVTWFSWGGAAKRFGDWSFFSIVAVWNFFRLLVVGSKEAVSFARGHKINYCLAAWSLPSGFYAYYVKKILGVPYGVWNLGSDLNKYARVPILRQLVVLSLKNADQVFANSYTLVKKASSLSGRKVYLLPAVTKIDGTNKNTKKRTSVFKFLYVGRLEKIKGPDVLIDGVVRLKKIKPELNFTVDILGGGNLKNSIRENIGKHELSDTVHLRGWADESMVTKFMRDSDCLLVPSRSESLPIVILEAAKFKLPIVSSNVGDCPFLIKKYNIGLSFESENAVQLANAMIKIMSGMGVKREFAKLSNDFSLEKSSKLFQDYVGQVVLKK